MADERARVPVAHRAGAIFIQRLLVQAIAGVLDVQLASRGKRLPSPSIARRQHAIKHVDTACDSFDQIFGSADPHQISWLIDGHARGDVFYHVHHYIFLFAHAETADGIAIEADVDCAFKTFAPELEMR